MRKYFKSMKLKNAKQKSIEQNSIKQKNKKLKRISVISLITVMITLILMTFINSANVGIDIAKTNTIQSSELKNYAAEPLTDGSVNAVSDQTNNSSIQETDTGVATLAEDTSDVEKIDKKILIFSVIEADHREQTEIDELKSSLQSKYATVDVITTTANGNIDSILRDQIINATGYDLIICDMYSWSTTTNIATQSNLKYNLITISNDADTTDNQLVAQVTQGTNVDADSITTQDEVFKNMYISASGEYDDITTNKIKFKSDVNVLATMKYKGDNNTYDAIGYKKIGNYTQIHSQSYLKNNFAQVVERLADFALGAVNIDGDFVDFIKPNATYQFSETDIDRDGKTFTMVFDMTDKFYQSGTLALEDLTILIDGEEPNWAEVNKSLREEDRTNTINGQTEVIGKRYTLELSNLEQIQVKEGENYLDYSGVITVAIPADKLIDTTGNGNNATTITSGINLPGGTVTGEVVDVVQPLVEKITSTVDPAAGTAALTFKATDKYFASTTLTNENLQITVDGQAVDSTGVTKEVNSTPLTEERVVNGENTTVQYGLQFTVNLSGLDTSVNQIKVRVPAGAVTDQSGNVNKETDLLIFNTLKATNEEKLSTSGFLGNYNIQRQNVDQVEFVDNVPSDIYNKDTKTYVNANAWDVSAMQDDTIIAWYETNPNGTYKVYIGSDSEMFGNVDSSYLFYYIGYSENCTSTETIKNLNLLKTGNVQNMSYMFSSTGSTAMTILDLGEFDTSNVTNMNRMFTGTGYTAMTSLDLGDKFNTSKVTTMSRMFENVGFTAMTNLDLGENFDTSNVTNMQSMFWLAGNKAMESLDLGNKFDTSNVTHMTLMFAMTGEDALQSLDLGDKFDTSNVENMQGMFMRTGYTAMTSLDLGENFDTSNVENMQSMFMQTGYTAMTSLDLGDKFDTSKVTDMSAMFNRTGYMAMTSLDLGDKFDTSSVTTMQSMFYGTGYTAMTSLNLGNKFNTNNVTNMIYMFSSTGYTAMTTLDLGSAFTFIPDGMIEVINQVAYSNMFQDTGKQGSIVIQAPEAIYQDQTHFKLSTDSSTTIGWTDTDGNATTTYGTITPKYRTEWLKEETAIDETDANNPKFNITLRGTTNVEVDPAEYTSDVNSSLAPEDIKVFIGNTEITDIVTKTVGTATATANTRTGAQDVLQTVTLSNFEEAVRQTGIPYKEWSGNLRIEVAQGSLSDTTGPTDPETNKAILYGNKNMEVVSEETQTGATTGAGSVTEIGARIDNIIQDETKVDKNTADAMFADLIKPEFTYVSQNTEISQEEEKVTIVFDVVDKFFQSTTLSNLDGSQITVQIDDYDPVELNQNITKQLTKVEDITGTVEGVENTKIGERYQLVITGLDQEDADGNGDGYHYSGYMTLSFAAGTVTDKSGNTSSAKSISIGKDDPGGQDGDEEIVDVVDPVWSVEEINTNEEYVKLHVKDKYLNKDQSVLNLTEDAITIVVNGQPSTAIATILAGPIEIVPNEEYEYIVTLENVTPPDAGYVEFTPVEPIVGGTAKYKEDNGGYIKLEIAAGVVVDQYGNETNKQTLEVGNLDKTKPEVFDVQKTQDKENGKETFVFNVTDKNYDPSDPVTLDEIELWMDGQQIDDQVVKNLISTVEIKANVNGEIKVLGHQYTLEVSEIVETDEEFIASNRDYRELSGTLEVRIDPMASKDMSENYIKEETATITDFTDLIDPEVMYQYSSTDIDYDGKNFTMEFNIFDKYYDTGELTIDDLTILIDGEEPDWAEVNKSLQVVEKTSMVNGTSKVIGHTYTLTLSNLEQLQVKDGENYLDYSGVVTVAIPADKIMDTAGNGNVATTLTSGINLPGGSGTEEVVDVVQPFVEKMTSNVDVDAKTATVTFTATDKFFANSTLTTNNIQILVNGTANTSITKTITSTPLNEQRTVNGATQTVQYGVQYTLNLANLNTTVNQIKVRVPEGLVTDQSGNTNKQTDLLLFNTLRNADSDINITANENNTASVYESLAFLGNTNIERKNVDNITFVDHIPEDIYDIHTGEYKDNTAWDVSAMQDKSILGWYEQNANGTYKVYIGSNDEIFGNVNSSKLFMYIGYGENCTSTETITNIELLNVSNVTNTNHMFYATGYTAMTNLDLGSNFDTSNVTDMQNMFGSTGYKEMTNLDLGDKFDTSKVTNIGWMFSGTGYTAMTSLDLGDKFDTSNVIGMDGAFFKTGYTKMTNLDLGDKFDTSNVLSMERMFYETGYTAMTSLDLGDKFDTSKVKKMYHMFNKTGYMTMTNLDLGDKFDTSSVTDMTSMFYQTGYTKMTTLDLGDKFTTENVTIMYQMFYGTGHDSMTTLDLGPAFTKIPSGNVEIHIGSAISYITETHIAYEEMFNQTGKTDEFIIQAPEAIYQNSTNFKLNTNSSKYKFKYNHRNYRWHHQSKIPYRMDKRRNSHRRNRRKQPKIQHNFTRNDQHRSSNRRIHQ